MAEQRLCQAAPLYMVVRISYKRCL
jgi:hypothetical protein